MKASVQPQPCIPIHILSVREIASANHDQYNSAVFTLRSVLFNYGSVYICENSNTAGRVTSQCETKWPRFVWLARSSSLCLKREENQGYLPRIEEDKSKSSLHKAIRTFVSAYHYVFAILFNYAL